MSQSHSSKLSSSVLLIASLGGLTIALYAYVTPLTGVTGSLGALIALFACVALAIMALLLAVPKRRVATISLRVVIFIALFGTFFIGLLLHQWWISVAMVVGLLGLILDMTLPSNQAQSTHS